MAIRSEQGIVLRTYPFGEADRIVVLISPNRGKMRTVAKGVRKTKSRFGGRLEPFTHIDVVVYEGRQLDTITQVSVIDPFAHLRLDLERVMAAGTMVETVDAVAQEGEASHRLFLLLNRGLKALDQGGGGRDLVSAFLLKLAGVVGVEPALTRCAACGNPEGLDRFSFSGGGAMCQNCRTETAVRLRPGLTGYLAGLASADFAYLPATDPALSGEAMGVARRFVEFHLDRRLGSLAVLDG
jgi:DNA repair protein RecO (recombination protein O)